MEVNRSTDEDDNDFFSKQCSNPMAWYKQHSAASGLSNNLASTDIPNIDIVINVRQTIMTDPYFANNPEYVWELYLLNTYIYFNYIMQDHWDQALKIIDETENILSKLTEHSTDFLNSIKNALYHIILTMKGYVLTKCHLSTENLNSFVTLREMDSTNTAALYAVQSAFSTKFTNKRCILSKICLLRAIALNPAEPEWHYMLSRCLTEYRKRLGMMTKVLPEELNEAKMAVNLSVDNNPHYKCHLAKLLHYVKNSNNYSCSNGDTATAKQLIKDIINDSGDVFILRQCVKILTKMMSITQYIDKEIVYLVETIIIPKIIKSNNSFAHESIGQYYIHYKKDLEKAKTHMKIASDGICFGASIDYILLMFKLDPVNTNVIEILDGYLDKYKYSSCQHILLSLMVTYQLLNKNDIVGALKYIDKLLNIKVISFIHRMQSYRTTFHNFSRAFNLLDVIFNQLQKNLKNESLSAENMSSIKRMLVKFDELNSFIRHTECAKTYNLYDDLDTKIAFLTQTKIMDGKCCMMTNFNNNQYDKSKVIVKSNNWRTLKPNDGPNVFTLSFKNAKNRYSIVHNYRVEK